jgi:hypothetical protein
MKLEKIRRRERYEELDLLRSNGGGREQKLSPRSFQSMIGKTLGEMSEELRTEFGLELMVRLRY